MEQTSPASPKDHFWGENMFFRPSYTPRGVKTLGAMTVCIVLMISKLRAAGSVFSEGEMTAATMSYVETNDQKKENTDPLLVTKVQITM